MKLLLLSFYILFCATAFAQNPTNINIIFESKKMIILNDGKQYDLLEQTPFYAVSDTTIQLRNVISDQLYRLNRVLIIKNDDVQKELIEWIKGKTIFYECRKTLDLN